MKKLVYFDFETRSKADIQECGAARYAEDPSTQILCTGYAIDDGPVQIEIGGWIPDCFERLIREGYTFVAHNAMFEYLIWQRFWGHPPPLKCTMAKASSCGLPRGLERAAKALRLEHEKDINGARLINKFSKPKPDGSFHEPTAHPEDAQAFYEYCRQDVVVEREIDRRLPDLSSDEQKIFDLTLKINVRGVCIDEEFTSAAADVVEDLQTLANKRLAQLTDNTILAVTQVERIKNFLNKKFNLGLTDLQSDTLEDLDLTTLPPEAQEIITLRQEYSLASVKKFKRINGSITSDGRIKDYLVYHGAITGRWSSKTVQFQNIPKGGKTQETCIALLKTRDSKFFASMYDKPVTEMSEAIRGAIIAAPGKKLIVADYAAIEARVLLWLVGQDDAVRLLEAGDDIYVDMARFIYNNPKLTKEDKDQRQLGKQAVLGCLSEDCRVYSDVGFISIKDLQKGQKLWDGKQWVDFQEKVDVGVKNVIQVWDLELTPDHLISTKYGWRTAAEIALNQLTWLQRPGQFLEDGRLLVQSARKAKSVMSPCAARAGLLKVAESTTSGAERLTCVLDVLRVSGASKVEDRVNILISSLIDACGKGGSFVGLTLRKDVMSRLTKTTHGMVLEVFPYPSNPVENSWNTLLHWMGMTNGGSPWIELTTWQAMKPETYDLLLKAKTIKTKQKRCYDIINSKSGFFQAEGHIVHNCGYQMGPKKFKITCEGYGISVSEDMAERAVRAYREKYKKVPMFWEDVERAAMFAYQNPGKRYSVRGKIAYAYRAPFLFCYLPSGRRLSYYCPGTEEKITPFGSSKQTLYYFAVDSQTQNFKKTHTYGGKLTENIVQAIARDIMADVMMRTEAEGFDIVLTVHDELVWEVTTGMVYPTNPPLEYLEKVLRMMQDIPAWAQGCPITAEGWEGTRYRK